MKRLSFKLAIIGVLSLFLLSKTPAADLSKNTEATSFDVISATPVESISNPAKTEITSLKQKEVKHLNSRPSTSVNVARGNTAKDTIAITGNTVTLFNAKPTNGNLPDAGNSVGVYNNRFYYGHNTANVFGKIERGLTKGSIFTVTKNGQTVKYQVKATLRLSKPDTQKIFRQIYTANYSGTAYDIAIMTCSGQSLPGRDATHRFMVFASRV